MDAEEKEEEDQKRHRVEPDLGARRMKTSGEQVRVIFNDLIKTIFVLSHYSLSFLY